MTSSESDKEIQTWRLRGELANLDLPASEMPGNDRSTATLRPEFVVGSLTQLPRASRVAPKKRDDGDREAPRDSSRRFGDIKIKKAQLNTLVKLAVRTALA